MCAFALWIILNTPSEINYTASPQHTNYIPFIFIFMEIIIYINKVVCLRHRDLLSYLKDEFYIYVSVHHNSILYKEPTRCNFGSILGNCPTWRTNSFQCIYLFIVLYMFRACHAHHQEKQIVSIQLYSQPAHDTATNTEWQLPEAVLIQFVSSDDEHDMLETCREL